MTPSRPSSSPQPLPAARKFGCTATSVTSDWPSPPLLPTPLNSQAKLGRGGGSCVERWHLQEPIRPPVTPRPPGANRWGQCPREQQVGKGYVSEPQGCCRSLRPARCGRGQRVLLWHLVSPQVLHGVRVSPAARHPQLRLVGGLHSPGHKSHWTRGSQVSSHPAGRLPPVDGVP